MNMIMKESEFQSLVMQAMRLHRLRAYHTFDSRRSDPGFPDLVIVGANSVLYRELKTETGRLSRHQQYWLAVLNEAGQDAAVWRPSDWPHRITRELRALGKVMIDPPDMTPADVRKRLASPKKW